MVVIEVWSSIGILKNGYIHIDVSIHSSEKRGLHSTYCSRETLKNFVEHKYLIPEVLRTTENTGHNILR